MKKSPMKTLNKNILFTIECPACLEYMQAPIYVCVVGHSICNSCWNEMQTCPTCNRDLSETRNFSLETLTDIIYYPCHNADYGCKEYLKKDEMKDHLLICSYRDYTCKVDGCNWVGKKINIKDHYVNVHRELVLEGPKMQCCWKDTDNDIYLMIAHKELFYVHRKTFKSYMYWVVQYIGKSEDVIQYYFQINIVSNEFQNRRVTISENCQDDIKIDITEIIDSGYAVGVPLSVMDSYRNATGHVWYHISIRKA